MTDIREKIINNYTALKNKGYIYEKKNGSFQPITYGDFADRVFSIADHFIKNGGTGKTYLLVSRNGVNLMEYDAAITLYVGTSVIAPDYWKNEEIADCADNIKADFIFFDGEKESEVMIASDRIKNKNCKLINMSSYAIPTVKRLEKIQVSDPDERSKVLFSSGTTGKSKGVMLSQRNLFAGIEPFIMRCGVTSDDSTLMFLPMSHTYGEVFTFLYSFVLGFSIFIASSIAAIPDELKEVNPTVFCAVPLIFERIYEANKDDLSSAFGKNIRYISNGGAPMRTKLIKAYRDSGIDLRQAYALSETASSFAMSYPFPENLESCGELFENMDIKIDSPDKDGVGEICAKGECVFMGYLNDKKATEKAFDADGYFHTGDLGCLRGRDLFITGRKKNIILSGNGETIDVKELSEKVKEINKNIVSVTPFLQNDLLCYKIYISSADSADEVERSIEAYNRDLPKRFKIIRYSLTVDSIEVRLKQ
ncbi:MAG: AMP-binding protein [Clostridiales bacterium]|nr:AMP-binding protein [Clostridiales bacterium]